MADIRTTNQDKPWTCISCGVLGDYAQRPHYATLAELDEHIAGCARAQAGSLASYVAELADNTPVSELQASEIQTLTEGDVVLVTWRIPHFASMADWTGDIRVPLGLPPEGQVDLALTGSERVAFSARFVDRYYGMWIEVRFLAVAS